MNGDPPDKLDRPNVGKRPFVVVVCGGPQYTDDDADWLRRRVFRLVCRKMPTHCVQFVVAPTPGAADVLYRHEFARNRSATLPWIDRYRYGRAAEFRAAWDSLAHADAMIVFNPPDLFAAYALELAGRMVGRGGRIGSGIQVAIVAARASAPVATTLS
jgi:hypothetical protein